MRVRQCIVQLIENVCWVNAASTSCLPLESLFCWEHQAAGQKVTPTPPPKAPVKRESVTRRDRWFGMVCARKGWRITVKARRTVAWGIKIPPTSPGFWMILMVFMTPNNYDDPPFSGSGWSCLAPQTRQDDESSVNTTNMIRQKAENVLIKCMTSCFIEKWRSSSLQFVVKLHGFVF